MPKRRNHVFGENNVPLLEKLKKESDTVRLFFATLIIIPLQAWMLISALTEAYISTLQTKNPQYFFPPTSITVAVFVVLPLVYCTIASLFFRPKRIVSPLLVQIGTMVVFSTVVIVQATTSNALSFTSPATYQNVVTNLIFIAMIAFIVGFMQEVIVKWVVALNFDSVDRATFTVEMTPKDFLTTTYDILRDVWEFNRRKDNPEAKSENVIWVLRAYDRYSNYVILTVGHIQGSEGKSTVATVAYHAGWYGVSKTKHASEMRDSIIRDINGLLTQNEKPNLVLVKDVDDTISVKAYDHALEVTRAKTEIALDFFKKIRRYYLFAIIFTGIALIATSIAYATGFLDSSGYIGSIVVIGIAFVLEFGASLAEEISKRRVEEIE
jgi:hypothetical protein